MMCLEVVCDEKACTHSLNSTINSHTHTLTHLRQPKPLVQVSSVDYSAPEVIERTNRLLEEYCTNDPPISEDDALVAIHKGVDPKAKDQVSVRCVMPSTASRASIFFWSPCSFEWRSFEWSRKKRKQVLIPSPASLLCAGERMARRR
jgi:hypothetical protein